MHVWFGRVRDCLRGVCFGSMKLVCATTSPLEEDLRALTP